MPKRKYTGRVMKKRLAKIKAAEDAQNATIETPHLDVPTSEEPDFYEVAKSVRRQHAVDGLLMSPEPEGSTLITRTSVPSTAPGVAQDLTSSFPQCGPPNTLAT